jgi:hypothetical protein
MQSLMRCEFFSPFVAWLLLNLMDNGIDTAFV